MAEAMRGATKVSILHMYPHSNPNKGHGHDEQTNEPACYAKDLAKLRN